MIDKNTVLDIDNLTVAYCHGPAWLVAVRDFSLRIDSGQTIGLVGESGSGKSTIALAIMQHLGENGQIQQGQITFVDRDSSELAGPEMRQVWGDQLILVPQDPLSSLNPSIPIGEQLAEQLRQHLDFDRSQARARTLELLELVKIPDPERVARSYPHQISGGMQQRVMIAMALSTGPRLLVLDEPTTALDVTTQASILDLFRELINDQQTAALYVTHNLGVVARICQRVVVLYAGELVEDAPTGELFLRPYHPYTQGLIDSLPNPGDNKRSMRLLAIPGQIPSLDDRGAACLFAPRCHLALDICRQERPPLEKVNDSRRIRCHRWREIATGEVEIKTPAAMAPEEVPAPETQAGDSSENPLLKLEGLHVHFDLRRPLKEILARQPGEKVKAVDGVSLTLAPGKTLGLVGESGSGKTSLARAVIGLEKASGGSMELLNMELPPGLSRRSRDTMRHLQIVFQNPEEALNPYHTIGDTLRRPFMTLLGLSRQKAGDAVLALLADVRLPAAYAQRRPDQLSGGEKQRVAIARAIAANPELLIADEPASALDVSVQASILNLLNDLQKERGLSILFISHDLAVVGYLADVIAVIYAGRLVEIAEAELLFKPPFHPYTEVLISAIPTIDPEKKQLQIRLTGDAPTQTETISGCPFHPRCPRLQQFAGELGDICSRQEPPWQTTVAGDRILCHIPVEKLARVQAL